MPRWHQVCIDWPLPKTYLPRKVLLKFHAAMSDNSQPRPHHDLDHNAPGNSAASTPGANLQAGGNASPVVKADTPVELRELAAAVAALPAVYRDSITPSLDRVVQCSTRRRRILNLVQEALSQLRLDMKYLIFDLEATRRERDEYRERLDNGESA